MGFFGFFKKKKIEEVKEENISIKKLESWLKNKSLENKEIEDGILKSVKDKINNFTKELEININLLKNFDLDKKKEEARIKILVKTALQNYIDQLEKLEEELTQIETWQEATKILHDFESKTAKIYEKVTYLIGKEMEKMKLSFQTLYKFLNNVEDREVSRTNQIITTIKQNLEEIRNIEQDVNVLREDEIQVETELNHLKQEEKQIIDDIKNVKQSPEYLDNLKRIEEKTKDENTLQQLILELRYLIDFKKLANIFHSDHKIMSKIKNYKERFTDALEDQRYFIELLNKANLNNEKIKAKLKQINKIKQKIKDIKIHEDKIKHLEQKLKHIREKISRTNPKHDKIRDKHKKRKEGILQNIKQELKKVNVNLTY